MASVGKASEKNIAISKGIIFAFFTIFLIFYGIFISNFIDIYYYNRGEVLPIYISYIPFVCYIGAIFLGINTFINGAYPSGALNVVWILIAVYGLIRGAKLFKVK